MPSTPSDLSLTNAPTTPRMVQNLTYRDPLLDIPIEHQAYKVDALLAHDPRHSEVVIHDLVYTIERILFVNDGVEQDAQGPDVLLLAAVSAAREDFGGGVVCYDVSIGNVSQKNVDIAYQ